MDKVSKALIDLLSVSTGCGMPCDIELDQSEWNELYSLAAGHHVSQIIYKEASKYGSAVCPDLFTKWRNVTIMQVLKCNAGSLIIGDILKAFENHGIPVMVLKGLHYKYLYTDPDMRVMGDIDLLTRKDTLDQAADIIRSFGYMNVDEDNPKHLVFTHNAYIPIELHFSLFTEEKRKIAVSFNREIWDSAYNFEKDGMKFLVPSQENQLIYCCIHMTNHFEKGAFDLRHLSDFNLLARNYCGSIDFDQLSRKADSYGLGKFIEVMLYICHELFELPVPESLVGRYARQKEYVDGMIDMILEAGRFNGAGGKMPKNRIVASYIGTDGSGLFSKLHFLFPPREMLLFSYPYVRKSSLLLPVAWIHRLVNNLVKRDVGVAQKSVSSKTVDEYVKIIKWLDIRRNK